MLLGVDRHVFGAVVHEHAVDLAHLPNEPNIDQEYNHPDHAFHNVGKQVTAEHALQRPAGEQRKQEEKSDCEQ